MSEERPSSSLSASSTSSSRRLERGDVPLDEALALWRCGEELDRACVELLYRAESKIETSPCVADDDAGRDSGAPAG